MADSRQSGVALITAMLIIAIATATAVAMASRQRIDIRQTANMIGRDRARMIALGGESWVRHVLTVDAEEGTIDALGDIWARKPPPITVEGGEVWGRIIDLQGRINLNNLVIGKTLDALAMGRFERLLEILGLPRGLATVVADWIDADNRVSGIDGAEDETYMGRSPPYPTANRPLTSLTELMLIEGFDHETVQALSPFVAALPAGTAINVNTAPPEVLMALHPEISRSAAETLEANRGTEGFQTLDEFLKQPELQNLKNIDRGITLTSGYFLATIRTHIGRGRVHLFTLFNRSGTSVRILRRSQGVF